MSSDTVKVLVAQLCLTLCDPMDCSPPGFSVPGIFQARILESLLSLGLSSPGDLPDPGIEPGSPALQADALTSDPGGKPREVPYVWSTSSLSIHLVMGLVTSTEDLRSGT